MPEMKVLASKDAEQSVLGSVFYDESQIKLLNDKLITDDFYYERHRHIFNAMIDLHKSQTPIDSTTVISLLEDRGQLVECGGAEYIIELTDSVPSVTNLIHYIDIVKDKAAERAVINACNDIIKRSNEGIENTKTFLDESEKAIFNATSLRTTKDMVSIGRILEATREKIIENQKKAGRIIGLATGYDGIDRATLGFQGSQLIILAARPSVGKSALALNIATNVCKLSNKPYVAFFSLEMGLEEEGLRLLASTSGVDSNDLKTGKLSNTDDWEKVNWAIKNLQDLNLLFDDSGSTTVQDVRSICRKKKAEGKLDMVIIDYLQLLSTAEKFESRTQQIGEITRVLKELARELKIPVIALSQLSRSGEEGEPKLSDLRESGSIEQDADIVMFLYRPKEDVMPDQKDDKSKRIINCSIAKNRSGMLAKFELLFHGPTTTFHNITDRDEE